MLRGIRLRPSLLAASIVLIMSACGDDGAGDNPVLGSSGPGADGTNYPLLIALALCLIGAGILLIKVERWQRRNHPD